MRWVFERLVALGLIAFAVLAVYVLAATHLFAWRGDAAAREARADVIVVLSAGFNNLGELDHMSAARTDMGVSLWRAGVAPEIIMSGGVDAELGLIMAEHMAARAIAAGVPAEAVHAETRSVSTFENARFVLEIAREKGWRTAVLLTDDFHIARGALLFWWWDPGELEVVALAASDGTAEMDWEWRQYMLFRETLAYPFNAVKLIGQMALNAMGRGDERVVR